MENQTKKQIIYSIIILVIIGVLVFFLPRILKNFNLIKSTPGENVTNEQAEIISLEELEKNFAKAISEKEVIVPVSSKPEELPLTDDQCQKIVDEEVKKTCFDYINLNSIVNEKKSENCKNLQSDLSDVCYYELILKSGENFGLCTEIVDKNLKNLCFKNVAVFSRNLDYCEEISVAEEKDECKDVLVSARVNQDNILECILIKSPLYFGNCVNNNKQNCEELLNEDLVNDCNSWRFFDKVIKNGDKAYCDILPAEKFKKVCYAYYEKGKFLDSDVDGLSDREELNHGTNPFVFDEGIKAQAESRRNKVDTSFQILQKIREEINLAIGG